MNKGKTIFAQLMSLFTEYEFSKGGFKIHTLMDLKGSIPIFIRLTDASIRDSKVMDEIPIVANAYYLMDL